MKENKISILVTNYNKSRFIKKSISRLISQNYKKFEIIIFDDHSVDNSIDILKSFKNIKLIRNKEKKKSTPALCQIHGIKKAFEKSSGEILCLMDADDYFQINKLKNINDYFKKNRSNKIVYDIPTLSKKKNFIISNYKSIKVWPNTFPTSCISVKRRYFEIFLNNLYERKFQNLEIDTRFMLFFKFYLNEYNILHKKLTIYNYDINGITANIPKFSSVWWKRRAQAFEYLKLILKKRKLNLKFNLDYYITRLLSFIINKTS